MSTSFHTIEWSVTEGIGSLIMTQPPSNKMTVGFFGEMASLKEMILKETNLKAIIVTGKGRHFSSGADLDELLKKIANTREAEPLLRSNYTALSFIETLNIPVISAIRGVCLGSALELAFFTHYRFCTEEAVFGLPETTFNLIPGIGGIHRFSRLAGNARALSYILTGNTFDAHTALDLGIADCILPKKRLLDEATRFARWLPVPYLPGMREVYLDRFLRHER